MSVKTISNRLKFIIVLLGIVCLGAYCALSLLFLVSESPEIRAINVPWLIFIWTTAVPVLLAIIFSWDTAVNIGKNIMFSLDNAKNLHRIAICAGIDCIIVSVGSIGLLLANMNHPSVVILLAVVVAFGLAALVAFECLSQLIKSAAKLQDDADLTI